MFKGEVLSFDKGENCMRFVFDSCFCGSFGLGAVSVNSSSDV
jgi:hypothetical protein